MDLRCLIGHVWLEILEPNETIFEARINLNLVNAIAYSRTVGQQVQSVHIIKYPGKELIVMPFFG